MIRPIYLWKKAQVNLYTRRRKLLNLAWIQGVILLICVVIAMLLANLPATREHYFHILETSLRISVLSPSGHGFSFPDGMTVEKFINDILMVVFFFTVGLEIKREVVCGELSSPKKAVMQDFMPTPMTASSVMFYSGFVPDAKLTPIFTEKDSERKKKQKGIFFRHK